MFNVSRTTPAPASLARRVSYSGDDVLKELRAIFFDKCYLCEEKNPHCINVEHFDPHGGDPDKKFDWQNLFYVCARCNNIKLAGFTNLLNCTDASVKVWSRIRLLPPRTPGAPVDVKAMAADPATAQTAKLLDDIYNSKEKSVNKQITSNYLRKAIYRKAANFLQKVEQYLDDEIPQRKRDEALECLKEFMKANQEFSAFLRWTAIEDEVLKPVLEPAIVD